jgi:hypothetical protein
MSSAINDNEESQSETAKEPIVMAIDSLIGQGDYVMGLDAAHGVEFGFIKFGHTFFAAL